jgi:regulator of replication initiation timing
MDVLIDRVEDVDSKIKELNEPIEKRIFDVRNYVEERLSEGDVPIKLTSEQLRDALDDRSMEKFVEEAIGEIDLTDEVKDAIETLCNSGSLDDAFSDPKVIRAMTEDERFMANLASELAGHEGLVNCLAEAFAESLRKSITGSKS